MFKSITLENFFSFGKSTKIDLNPDVNILVGINGSGKSNFIRAIQLLIAGVREGALEKLINQKWGGAAAICNYHPSMGDGVMLGFEFDIPHLQQKFKRGLVSLNGSLNYAIQIETSLGANFHFFENLYSPERSFLGDLEGFERDRVSGMATTEHPSVRWVAPEIKEFATYQGFDTSAESPIRQMSGYFTEKQLLPNGENLTMVLSSIQANHPLAFDQIVEVLQKVNPNFKDLVFSTPVAGKTYLTLKEKHLGRTIPIDFISDGTLRFLLLLAILYNPNRGAVICLDEPEMGLHPDMIATIAEGVKHAGKTGTQMIVSTHSPLLLNAFELEDILIFEKDEQNQTTVSRKYEEDFKDWEGEFLAGQMWLRGQLGGVRW